MSRKRFFLFVFFVLVSVGFGDRLSANPPGKTTVAATAKPPLMPQEVFSLFRAERKLKSGQEYFKGATYVGAENCARCHAKEYADWQQTWHAKMEQWPTPETMLGNFNDKIIKYADIEVQDKAGKKSTISFDIKAYKDDSGYYYTILDRDDPANNQTYKIAKTLGGKWDQGYEVKLGESYFPAPLRYSVKQNAWLVKAFNLENWMLADGTPDGRPRRPDELPMERVAEAKCAGCHTTGFEFKKEPKSGLWEAHGDGRLGIGCEKCHGPGSEHVKAADKAKAENRSLTPADIKIVHGLKDLDHNQQTQLCAQCHGRATNRKEKDLSFPQGFLPGDTDVMEHLVFWNYQSTANAGQARYFYANDWAKRNRQQWQDFVRSTHFTKAGQSCLTCHAFHGKTEDMQLRNKPANQCSGCHTQESRAGRPQTEMFAGSPMETAGVQCIDCHMARIGFRSHLTEYSAKVKHYPMDGSAHHFFVPTPAVKDQFGVRTACEVCHDKDRPLPDHLWEWIRQKPMTNAELGQKLGAGQSEVRIKLARVQGLIATVKSPRRSMSEKLERARALAAFVQLDGSSGFHNFKKANAMLDEAFNLATQAGGADPGEGNAAAVAGYLAVAVPASGGTAGHMLAVAKPADAVSSTPGEGQWYESVAGDTLWALAKKHYGRGADFERIVKANAKTLQDPDYLPPRTRLFIPAKTETGAK